MMQTATPTTDLMFLGSRARILATGAETGGAFALVEMIDMPPGDQPPLHVHHNEDEGFYVIDGEATLYMPGREITLRAGDFFLAPRGIPHTYCVGPEGAHCLVTSSPAGFENFVAEVAALETPDPESLGAAAARSGIEILGPPGMRP